MKVLQLSLLSLLLAASSAITAQGIPVPATAGSDAVETTETMTMGKKTGSMFEFGIRPSYMFVAGDVQTDAGFGVGVHLRKSLDHLFSLRIDGLYGVNSGMDDRPDISRQYENTWISGSAMAVMTLNNFRFNGDTRSTNFYVMAGAGGNLFEVERQPFGRPWQEGRNDIIDQELTVHAVAGAGVTFRLSPRINLGAEFQSYIPFGDRADRLDGYDNGQYRDLQNVASLSINFNIGNPASQSEPLYWTNAFDPMRQELALATSKIDEATKDSDGDGVVDAVDQEANTPAGVPVDTRGRVLDSDKDGVPDHKDIEPFFPPRAGETIDENGMVNNRDDKPITEDRVQEMIDASIARSKAGNQAGTTTVRTDRGEVFLPMIYFPLGQSTVKYSDYGTLSSVARVIQGNPGLRMVIRGYTDRTGNTANNEVLSYRRALAVIDHLVNQHGISRDSFVLQYRGEENAIVPLDKSYINRRVEFLTASAGMIEEPAPAGAGNNNGGY